MRCALMTRVDVVGDCFVLCKFMVLVPYIRTKECTYVFTSPPLKL
jgi:hypothetical protein